MSLFFVRTHGFQPVGAQRFSCRRSSMVMRQDWPPEGLRIETLGWHFWDEKNTEKKCEVSLNVSFSGANFSKTVIFFSFFRRDALKVIFLLKLTLKTTEIVSVHLFVPYWGTGPTL